MKEHVDIVLWLLCGVATCNLGFLAWLAKDYLTFRMNKVPKLVTSDQCGKCREAADSVLLREIREIKERLAKGDDKFEAFAVNMAKIAAREEKRL